MESLGTSPKNLEPDQKLVTKRIAIYITLFFPYGFRMILSIINEWGRSCPLATIAILRRGALQMRLPPAILEHLSK